MDTRDAPPHARPTRRPAWDEAQERQRRARAYLAAEHEAAAAERTRPTDQWRVCGLPITTAADRGCTCAPHDPTPMRVTDALTRISTDHRKEASRAAH